MTIMYFCPFCSCVDIHLIVRHTFNQIKLFTSVIEICEIVTQMWMIGINFNNIGEIPNIEQL